MSKIISIDPDDKRYEPRLVPSYFLGKYIGMKLIAVKKSN